MKQLTINKLRILLSLLTLLCGSFQVKAEISTNPPDRSLISIGTPDAGGIATIAGAPGAVAGNATVWASNLQTSQYNWTEAAPDGSFSLDMFAPPGTWLSIHQNPTFLGPSSLAPGTMIHNLPDGDAFAAVSAIETFNIEGDGPVSESGVRDGGQAWIGGTLTDRHWEPGDNINLNGDFIIYSRNTPSTDVGSLSVKGGVSLQRVFDAQGNQELANPEFMSNILTPTGFALERDGITDTIRLADIEFGGLSAASDRTIESTWSTSFQVPANLPDGVYQLVFEYHPFTNRMVQVEGLPNETVYFEGAFGREGSADPLFAPGLAGLIDVGDVNSRRLSWALLVDDFSNGARSVVSSEDRNRLQVAAKVSHAPRYFVLPKNRRFVGGPYRLEPYAPLVSASNRAIMSPPTVPFAYPSGLLAVSVRHPSGGVTDLGSAPFAGSYFQEPAGPTEGPFTSVSNSPKQYFGLTTLDSRFDFAFAEYGLYEIIVNGSIEDIHGKVYTGGGTYEVFVAEHLDLEPGTFPSTPFEVGDALSPALIVQPGVAANVEVRVRHYPESDTAQVIEKTFTGRANRFGYFQPRSGDAFTFDAPGEYRVDYSAWYWDDDGALWMGSQSWGSVVATPNSPIITHGKRGMDNGSSTTAWFTVRDSGSFSGHMHFPYFNGDIMWMEDTDTDPTFTADVPTMTLQDTGNGFSDMYYQRIVALPAWMIWEPDFVDIYINTGELPMMSTSSSGLSPVLQRGAADNHWAYGYLGAARPGVRVRETVTEFPSDNSYWRFDDAYNYQAGVGANGDLTNDFKFQYIGSVYRAPNMDFFYYGIHGSMWTLVPPDDPVGVRVFPPFQGNGGGPDGGPIMTLKGEDIDLFFQVGGTRPGSILELGDVATFAGNIAPTLETEVAITVTAPSGAQRSVSGTSNKIGWFYDPGQDFTVDETGAWEVHVTVQFEGQHSAGQVTAPFPTGDVLGSRDGKYWFYVVEPSSTPLDVDVPAQSLVQPGIAAIDISMLATDELTDVTVHQTTVMPGFVLEESTGDSLSYSYDAAALHQDFPNLDISDPDGKTGVDTVTMSFLVTGVDGGGNTVHRARQVLLQGEELLAPAQEPTFFISGGVNDAWVHSGADKQGMFLTAFPNFGLMFAAWFTFDSVPPPGDATAVVGAPDQRWVTALGPYSGSTATLNAELTSGGRFNSSEGDPQQDNAYGTLDIAFDHCNSANVNFNFPSVGESGSFTMNRVLDDNVAVCQGIIQGSIVPEVQSDQARLQTMSEQVRGITGAKSVSAAFGINPGMNDAWVNAAAPYQGMFLTIFPELSLIFAAWFTFDTEPNGESATFGAADQRWLTALGSYSGTTASLNVENTTGGSFNSTDPSPSQDADYGTMQIDFSDCNNATVTYNIPSAMQSGEFTMTRVLDDNAGLCEALVTD